MSDSPSLSRKDVLSAGLATFVAGRMGFAPSQGSEDITVEDLKVVEKIVGLEFTDDERKAALADVKSTRAAYTKLRTPAIPVSIDPMTAFRPLGPGPKKGVVKATPPKESPKRPTKDEDLAFLPVHTLGRLLRTGQVSSVELTKLYLDRLNRFGDALLCVITLTEERAMRMAEQADAELKAGKDRGPLHGIPCGIKDLFATKGYRTTWGANPFENQQFDFDAALVERLDAAGAVIVAKLSMGALAMDDVWFRGKTKNPWNPKQGSSGSSAGSGSALAAGLVPFAIGTETYGSITSPSLRCRVTGFRPTFGRVSRFGAMELSYTMDKVGPICRDATDCALVFAAICGADARDAATVDGRFSFPYRKAAKNVRVGFLGSEVEMGKDPAVKALREWGATVELVKLTELPDGVFTILDVECASAFDEFTRSGKVRELKDSLWPTTFRAARYVPAIEYIAAQRARTLAMQTFEREFGDFDALLAVGMGPAIGHSNFGGHPQVMLPWGDDGKGNSVGRSLVGRLYQDDLLLTIARAVQERFDFHRQRPKGF